MKKAIPMTFALALALVAGTLLTGCVTATVTDDAATTSAKSATSAAASTTATSGAASTNAASVVGTWKLSSASDGKDTLSGDQMSSFISALTFNSDGTCSVTIMGITANTTYTVNGNTITFPSDGPIQIEGGTATFSGDQITMKEDSDSLVFVRQS